MALIKCDQCGNMVSENATSCPKCGNPMNGNAQAPQGFNPITGPKDRKTTAFMALFLGGFGVHYFYLGKTIPAVVFLAVNIIGIFIAIGVHPLLSPSPVICIICIIQAIKMFNMTDETFNETFVNTTNPFPLF